MIGEQSQLDNDEDNQSTNKTDNARIKLITNKRKFLEEKSAQVYICHVSILLYCTYIISAFVR